jgi:general secretion pathway protein A
MVSVPEQTRLIWLGEPPDTSDELLLFLTQELHVNPKSPGRVFVFRDIKEHLLKLHGEGNRCLLIIDEVQKISDDVLECVRLLNNLEQGSVKLIQIFLIGQEEFLAKLTRPELESFKQRIAWLEALGKMSPLQTLEYIVHRLKVSGCKTKIFTDDAMEALIGATRGTPRLVNLLCDRALRVGYEAGKTTVDLGHVRRAADDVGLGSEVFLWLTNREKKKAKDAELQASAIEDNPGLAVSDPKRMDVVAVDKNRPAGTHQDISQWSVFSIMNGLFDKTVGRLSDSPIVQLIASILLFVASIWFYIVHTR